MAFFPEHANWSRRAERSFIGSAKEPRVHNRLSLKPDDEDAQMKSDYSILLPPYKLDFDNWTKEQADDYLTWFVDHVPIRAQYLVDYYNSHKLIGRRISATDPSSLLPIWRWFLNHAIIEPMPEAEIQRQRMIFGKLGESMIAKKRFDVVSEYIIRDIAMLMSHIWFSNHSVLSWCVDYKPKKYVFVNRPVIQGFIMTEYEKPFHAKFEPVHMVKTQAVRLFRNRADGSDLMKVFNQWDKYIPSE